jgi:hypothetical protein
LSWHLRILFYFVATCSIFPFARTSAMA